MLHVYRMQQSGAAIKQRLSSTTNLKSGSIGGSAYKLEEFQERDRSSNRLEMRMEGRVIKERNRKIHVVLQARKAMLRKRFFAI